MKANEQISIDMQDMYAGAYMVLRAMEDNFKGAIAAHKEAGSPADMESFIRGKRSMLKTARSELTAIGQFVSSGHKAAMTERVESLIKHRKEDTPDAE